VTARSYLPRMLRASRPLVWWADLRDVPRKTRADELVDRLGLDGAHYDPCTWLIEVRVARQDALPCAVPTVLDACGDHRFRPQPASELAGRTVPLSELSSGLPEWVGRPISTERVVVAARGHVEGAASSEQGAR